MPEEPSQGPAPREGLHTYPQKESMATPAFANANSPLLAKIRARIAQSGPVRFRDYMQMALYDPEFGYYASQSQKVGKEGDFVTSVSVGECFGLILARRLFAFWEENGRPGAFHIIEPGAHTGTLCADILGEIQSYSAPFFETVHYHLIEATPFLRDAQQATLGKRFMGKYSSYPSLAEVQGLHGVVISNELIDAFPVDLVKFQDGKWWQLYVDDSEGELTFIMEEPGDLTLQKFCATLGDTFPDGYLTEFNPGIASFVQDASSALSSGLMITIDYGHHGEDYYHPARTTGTLQTYHQHQKSDDPLAFPGAIDITCHVDFSCVISEATAAGFSEPNLSTQASYLTTHARNWLISLESAGDGGDAGTNLLRQFQTLTHPAMLGTKFMVLEMHKKPQ